jgi:hypothetical protein
MTLLSPSPAMTDDIDLDVDDYGLGMLFEGEHPTTLKHFEWTLVKCQPDKDNVDDDNNNNNESLKNYDDACAETAITTANECIGCDHSPVTTAATTTTTINVALHCINNEPGAVQSGHYIWPASIALVDYLVSSWSEWIHTPQSILELGAGTALVSLATIQLSHAYHRHFYRPMAHSQEQQQQQSPKGMGQLLPFFVISDHDPTVLERARENYETTRTQSLSSLVSLHKQQQQVPVLVSNSGEVANEDTSSHISYDDDIHMIEKDSTVYFHHLSWGNTDDIQKLQAIISHRPLDYSNHHFTNVTSPTIGAETSPPPTTTTFDLILGSDLIYCLDVVEPLFQSVAALMTRPGDRRSIVSSVSEEDEIEDGMVASADVHHNYNVFVVGSANDDVDTYRGDRWTGRFLLSQSFGFDLEIEKEIDRLCHAHDWDRIVHVDTLSDNDHQGIKIQEFVPSRH